MKPYSYSNNHPSTIDYSTIQNVITHADVFDPNTVSLEVITSFQLLLCDPNLLLSSYYLP